MIGQFGAHFSGIKPNRLGSVSNVDLFSGLAKANLTPSNSLQPPRDVEGVSLRPEMGSKTPTPTVQPLALAALSVESGSFLNASRHASEQNQCRTPFRSAIIAAASTGEPETGQTRGPDRQTMAQAASMLLRRSWRTKVEPSHPGAKYENPVFSRYG